MTDFVTTTGGGGGGGGDREECPVPPPLHVQIRLRTAVHSVWVARGVLLWCSLLRQDVTGQFTANTGVLLRTGKGVLGVGVYFGLFWFSVGWGEGGGAVCSVVVGGEGGFGGQFGLFWFSVGRGWELGGGAV